MLGCLSHNQALSAACEEDTTVSTTFIKASSHSGCMSIGVQCCAHTCPSKVRAIGLFTMCNVYSVSFLVKLYLSCLTFKLSHLSNLFVLTCQPIGVGARTHVRVHSHISLPLSLTHFTFPITAACMNEYTVLMSFDFICCIDINVFSIIIMYRCCV